MTGAQALLQALLACGVNTCFANPGTSEMHLVAALDDAPAMRAVLGLFEGVVTGAADGYGRMTGHPAATLVHLGPGLANGLANLHNAKRAATPVVNLVGDHATYHQRYDAPLQSDIAALATTVSGWYRSAATSDDLGADVVDAVAAALGPPGQVATLVVPADLSWSQTKGDPPSLAPPARTLVDEHRLDEAASVLASGVPTVVLLGASALRDRGLEAASRLAEATGARLVAETFPARLERGAGRPPLERLAYLPELASAQLGGARHLLLVEARRPVSFFAYPGLASDLVPQGCHVTTLVRPGEDAATALEALLERVGGSSAKAVAAPAGRPEPPHGPLDAPAISAALGATLPEDAVVVDEGNTAGIYAPQATAGCPPHDWLTLTGGAIGQGIPLATGAAVGAPGRPVICLEADGSALYTLQGLWTQARESLEVTTVVVANRSYAILELELARTGAGEAQERARRLLTLEPPTLSFAEMARGLGVPATTVATGEELTKALERAFAEPGPALIEAVVPSGL